MKCNTNITKGCTDNMDAVKLKITEGKVALKMDSIDQTLLALQQAILDFCEEEGANLTILSNKLAEAILVNDECCDVINLKLETLIDVISEISICAEPCSLAGSIECNVGSCSLTGSIECEVSATTETPTTTVADDPTTTIIEEPTTTETNDCVLTGGVECDVVPIL